VIALISATWDEITLLKRDVQVTEEGSNGDLEYRIGELSGQPILLAVAGVGIRRARTGTSFIIQKLVQSLWQPLVYKYYINQK